MDGLHLPMQGHGFNSRLEKIPHAVPQNSYLGTTATRAPRARALGATEMRSQFAATDCSSLQLEKARAQQ